MSYLISISKRTLLTLPLPFSINTFNVLTSVLSVISSIAILIPSLLKKEKLLILNITYFFLKFIYTYSERFKMAKFYQLI